MARFIFFFFQAEDGIRDLYVTGVQTCALPILLDERGLHLRKVRRALEQHVLEQVGHAFLAVAFMTRANEVGEDRKSTRLNSSHVEISYAVFCLKKKKKKKKERQRNSDSIEHKM